MSIHHTAIIGGLPETREVLLDPATWDHAADRWYPRIDESAHVGPFVTVDAGTKRHTSVCAGALLLARSHIGHDALIGAQAEISTGAIIGGHAEVAARAKVGLGAVLLPYRKIGPGAVIGAGAVVTKDVPGGETWAGNPARKLDDDRRDPRPHSERSSPRFLEGRCGNCNEVTDRLPCPHCAQEDVCSTWEQMFERDGITPAR